MYSNIKELNTCDFPELINIWERSVKATHDFLIEKDFLFYKSRLSIYLANLLLYGEIGDNGIIKGFIGLSDDKIEMLFVDSLYFNSGIGSRLLKYAIDQLYITKVDANEQNKKALNFYIKHGFQQYDRSELDGEGKNYPILNLKIK